MRNAWKWVGLAGAVGVAAGGVLVARDQRQRNSYSADDVRQRLHQRHAEARARADDDDGDGGGPR
ncbi:hypothetical protein GIY30_05470 [Gordonia sp. HNM0687]|uniref:Uncharacterized protein n=1 Tax=Gordonia mangrovi TaxID=2665643 RepID=A0A6L7GMS4_9ACTN|nr:hypothetical protein [Gordonia mangrovi]MDY6811200.1 hypothetical protein [Actinomycetota bacterium]MXP20803.1 hypothetical protein [Gordonia mangrovi]UVF78631.1 hypothetical protein NWF22_01765 [Gordonia mangrovi]